VDSVPTRMALELRTWRAMETQPSSDVTATGNSLTHTDPPSPGYLKAVGNRFHWFAFKVAVKEGEDENKQHWRPSYGQEI